MKYSEIKAIKTFCADLDSTPDWREVLECVLNDQDDFEVDNVRFISDDEILSVLADELQNDLYILGCFNASFIADQIDIDMDVIKALQDAESFEALGKLIQSQCDMEEFAEAYASADGYGHHFNSYDFSEEEITINGTLYHVFDNR